MFANYPISESKRLAVSEYLGRQFPDCKLGEHYDHDSNTHVFRLSKRGGRFILRVSREFFEGRRREDVYSELSTRGVATALNRCGSLLLTNRGLDEIGK